jgi:hypothetical protein
MKYISWLGYANEILVVNQWEGIRNITCESGSPNCVTNGQQIIDSLDMKNVIFDTNLTK